MTIDEAIKRVEEDMRNGNWDTSEQEQAVRVLLDDHARLRLKVERDSDRLDREAMHTDPDDGVWNE